MDLASRGMQYGRDFETVILIWENSIKLPAGMPDARQMALQDGMLRSLHSCIALSLVITYLSDRGACGSGERRAVYSCMRLPPGIYLFSQPSCLHLHVCKIVALAQRHAGYST
ncbi:hypothetical protein DUNSADRAFT_17983 [Dunaliella salina]|uniref:Encoded protein n=1 Tax=Dunaliella salina TaxID=3046 RepID=A0ABQ7G0W6_DUNSA|nr:hypothetical protein DUNSADRAFT_17983 [Dunaliella salina]|eukprot:KAF5828244.1 hypothetical protein DUNSADRAFT_17983 [Dunaliella salina]